MTAWLISLGLGPRLAKAVSIVGVVAAAALALWLWGGSRYRAGVLDERHRWELARAEQRAADEAKARIAEERRSGEVRAGEAKIDADRKDLDDATADLPDESPSARRRARFCRELRERAARDDAPSPQC